MYPAGEPRGLLAAPRSPAALNVFDKRRLYMYVYIYIYIHTYIHMYVCTYIYIYIERERGSAWHRSASRRGSRRP